MTGDIDYS